MPSAQQFEAHLAALPPEAETRFAAMLVFACQQVHTLADQMGGIDAFVLWEKQLYDVYVVPIDVPWIPNVLEPAIIDAPAKQIIEAATRRAYARGIPLLLPVTPPSPPAGAAS
jgi:hypothetical protein